MSLVIAIPKTTAANEKRVAASPDTIKKLVAAGCKVQLQAGAGEASDMPDAVLKDAGAKICKNAAETLRGSHIVLCVQAPSEAELKDIPKGALVIGQMNPYQNEALFKKMATAGIDVFAMELVPRITRAQAMDVLSSQANLAGYKAVLDACEHFGRALPMMMTAAGTVPPARVFVMGAGVAGLQAIATAKRLGAVVSATDVRPAAKEQVQSLGGSFVAVEDEEFKAAETAGGYAKEMSAAYQKKQAALIEETIAKQDIVITTALIPGRPAPQLISAKMIASMKPGAVVIDLAAPQGGNVEGTQKGKVVQKGDVKIVGYENVPSRLAATASALYAKNLLNLVMLLIDKESGKLNVNMEDDIIKGVCISRSGKIVHPLFKKETKAASAKENAPKPKAKKTATVQKNKTAAKKTPAKKTASKKSTDAKTVPVKKTATKKAATKKS